MVDEPGRREPSPEPWESELDRHRAGVVRRRARIYIGLVAVLWVPLALFADPLNYGSVRAGLWSRLPTLAVLVLTAALLGKLRRRWTVELAVVAAFGFVAVVWARVVMVCSPPNVISNLLSILASIMGIGVGLLLSARSTALLCAIASGSMLVGGLLRTPPPDGSYFSIWSTSLVFFPMLILGATSRDRWQRAEFKARHRLREANVQLERERQARSSLFVNLSHDFRTPLAVVRTEVERLRRRMKNVDEVTALDRIDDNAASIVDLIDQLLELARLDAARTPVAPRPCDLGKAARQVAAQLQPQRADLQIAVTAGETVWARVDPGHLRRILQNLVANALRQLEARGGRVEVRAGRNATGAPVLEVIDDGPGIAPELRGKLFERFASFRPEGGTASGIGLALARQLAELNGGSLDLAPDAPQTTFRLVLLEAAEPAVEGDTKPAPAVTSVEFRREIPRASDEARGELLAARSAPGRGPTLLIVEDNDDLRASLVGLLGSRFDVTAVGTLADARRALRDGVPDAIATDVMLPDGDGYALLAEVRELRRLDRVPVILVTALGETDERVRGLAAGADDYVTKPFSGDELAARIASAIESTRERNAAVDRQREELLMELHDGVCGSLARAALSLDRLAARPGVADDPAFAGAATGLRQGLAESRGLLAALGSAREPWDAFVAQLRWESAAACERAGVAIDFRVELDASATSPVLPAVAHALRRITAEGITNAIRHGRPTAITVALQAEKTDLRVEIEDNGHGADAQPGPGGHGLSGVRRRAQRLGGDAAFGKARSGGWRLEAWVRRDGDRAAESGDAARN